MRVFCGDGQAGVCFFMSEAVRGDSVAFVGCYLSGVDIWSLVVLLLCLVLIEGG